MGVKLIYNKNRIANINLWLEITKPKTAQIPIYELYDGQQPEAVKKSTGGAWQMCSSLLCKGPEKKLVQNIE